ncbi:MAG: sigma-70 family RNA polymerase sigma factor [Sedimentisphaerales bacterium]|nr:sigma-70 family RNA polymerase sigma factor [Sedimentisphaerales bacterium]
MNEPTDEILVQQALQGDTGGFAKLIGRYYPALVALAHAVVADRHLAEDIAQEAVAEACRRLRTLRQPQRFGAWLGTICRNVAKDTLTERRRHRTAPVEMQSIASAPTGRDGDADEAAQLTDAVCRLPEHLRQVVFMRYYNAMTYEQMSNVLGLSPQAINGRLRRARRQIARSMKANGFGDNDR